MSKKIRGKNPTVAQKKLLASAGLEPLSCLYVKEHRNGNGSSVEYEFVDRSNGKRFLVKPNGTYAPMVGGDDN